MVKYYTSKEIAVLLNVSEECFHREIKKLIKRDFKMELKSIDVANPDILLDENNIVFLADPTNHNTFFETSINIFDYIEDANE